MELCRKNETKMAKTERSTMSHHQEKWKFTRDEKIKFW